jgi:SAM-dependent methyltransferase
MLATVEQGLLKEQVRSFWEKDPCGSGHAKAAEGTAEFFAQVEAARVDLEPFIAAYAGFDRSRGETVLEIGCGLGTDLIRFGRAGAQVTGVDLTEHSVQLVRTRLELEGLDGRIERADAESLPFEDGEFDHVYSWGVLHHTPNTERAIGEALRVLRPGGRLTIMLYARRSWVAWGYWVRHALLAGKPRRSVADVLASHMESPGTKAYTAGELREMLAGVDGLTIEHVATPYDRAFAWRLADLTGSKLGWFVVVRGRKPVRRY